MTSAHGLQRRLIAGNEDEFGLHYLALKFPGRRRRIAAERQRQERLAALADGLNWTAGGTKPYLGELAPGCRKCVAGSWSCLFVNASCNASCFYCPAPQDRREIPATNNLFFRHPEAYATYLQRLGFNGASISGGEPLLTLNRTLAFLRAARQGLGPEGHLWLYTNGILLTRDIAARLAAAGLDEIRFDIGATGYRCHQIEAAAGLIPTISVEIPAVPEALPTLKQVLPDLPRLSVNHLNLHQLRLTRHNFKHLSGRNYTFLHGEKITVLESELAALDILDFVQQNRIALSVNYCSFIFKHRHQNAAARRRAAELEKRPRETVTPAGFIRKLALAGEAERLNALVREWEKAGHAAALWQLEPDRGLLQTAPELIPQVRWHRLRLLVSYDRVQLTGQDKRTRGDWDLPLGPGTTACVSRSTASPEFVLGRSSAERFYRHWVAAAKPAGLPVDQRVFSAWESIPEGLQDYF
jgi:pyruvate formate-lyase activating enzyme-like uncharacterized protein